MMGVALHRRHPPQFRSALIRPLLRVTPFLCCPLFFLSPVSARHPSAATWAVPPSVAASPDRDACRFGSTAFAPCAGKRARAKRRRASIAATTRTVRSAAAAMILDSPSAERNKGPIWDVLSEHVLPSLLLRPGSAGAAPAAAGAAPPPLRVLEVAAGCGVHTLHFASAYVGDAGAGRSERRPLEWYPTDPDGRSRESVDARVAALPPGSPVREAVKPARALTLGEPGAAGIRDGIVTRRVDTAVGKEQGRENSPLHFVAGDGGNQGMDLVICINMIHISPWSATLGLMSCASAALKQGGVLYCYGPFKVGGTAVESNLNFDRSLRMRDPNWGVRDLEEVVEVASQNGLELVRTIEMPANNLSVIFRKL